jgi:hypothetical protein
MTANQVIVLLDVSRGFDAERHLGTLRGDVAFLENADLIRDRLDVQAFKYKLTARGQVVVDRILEQAELR